MDNKRLDPILPLLTPSSPNVTDPLFNPVLVVQVQETAEGTFATFDFTLATNR